MNFIIKIECLTAMSNQILYAHLLVHFHYTAIQLFLCNHNASVRFRSLITFASIYPVVSFCHAGC